MDRSPIEIFLSYSWSDSDLAEQLYNDLTSFGLRVIKDKKTLRYTDNIKEFMQRVRDTQYVLLLVSDSYLRSPNCMYETLELLKERDYQARILPVVTNAKIYKPRESLEYIKFWKEEYDNLKQSLATLEVEDAISYRNDLRNLNDIRLKIEELIQFLKDHNHFTSSDLTKRDYKQLFEKIGFNSYWKDELLSVLRIEDSQVHEIELERFLGKYPNNRAGLYQKAYFASYKKEFKKAIYFYQSILELYPDDKEVMRNIGLNIVREGSNPKEAHNYFEKAEAYYDLAVLLFNHYDDFAGAKKNYERSIEKGEDRLEYTYSNYGHLLYNTFNDKQGAEQSYRKALEIDTKFFSANLNLGILLLASAEIETKQEGIMYLKKAIELTNDNSTQSDIYVDLAKFYREQNNVKECRKYLRKALKLNTNNGWAYKELALLYSDESERSYSYYKDNMSTKYLEKAMQDSRVAQFVAENLTFKPL